MKTRLLTAVAVVALLAGCATRPPKDLTAFNAAKPASLLVLPPLNETPDPDATGAVLAQISLPLAESGYYVMPVSLVAETLKQNGMQTPHDMHQIAAPKLREVFGADAAVYITVKQYGSKYMVIASDTVVSVEARIVDLRSGAELWTGQASAASSEESSSNQLGLVGLLVKALVEQIVSSATDRSFPVAGRAVNRLLFTGTPQGIPAGPRKAAAKS